MWTPFGDPLDAGDGIENEDIGDTAIADTVGDAAGDDLRIDADGVPVVGDLANGVVGVASSGAVFQPPPPILHFLDGDLAAMDGGLEPDTELERVLFRWAKYGPAAVTMAHHECTGEAFFMY